MEELTMTNEMVAIVGWIAFMAMPLLMFMWMFRAIQKDKKTQKKQKE